MNGFDVLHVLWRLGLYVIYGALAIVVFHYVFQLPAPWAGVVALGILLLGLLKDLYDEVKDPGTGLQAAYTLVDHNPFNIIILWGVFSGQYSIADPYLSWAVIGIAGVDTALDGYRDITADTSAYTYPVLWVLMFAGVYGIHQLYGISAAVSLIEQWAQYISVLLG